MTHSPNAQSRSVSEHRMADEPAMIRAVVEHITAALKEGVAARGVASLVVCGGRSPLPVFAALRYRTDIPWSQVSITLADERWVTLDHDASNERLVRHHLLRDAAEVARLVPLKTSAEKPADAVVECTARLKTLPQPFDIVLLGMGEDGHFASLFPGAVTPPSALEPGVDSELCCAVTPTNAPHARMTLTLSALTRSRSVSVLITGLTKRALYERARSTTGPVNELPIRALLLQSRCPVDVWVVQPPPGIEHDPDRFP